MAKITRKMVAEAAGVGEATVSRAFNNPGAVKPDKVERILAAAEQLGWSPDPDAAALRRKDRGDVLFLEYQSPDTGSYNWPADPIYHWFYGEIIRVLSRAMDSTGYRLRLAHCEAAAEGADLAAEAAAVLAFNLETQDQAAALESAGRPFVCCHHTQGLTGVPIAASDNVAGGKLVGQTAADRGYEHMIYVTGSLEHPSHGHRLEGVRAGFGGAIDLHEITVGFEGGRAVGAQLAADGRIDDQTVIAAVNDITAMGIAQGLNQGGVHIPGDVALVGYDDLPLNLGGAFDLATVNLRIGDVYREALASLLSALRGEEQERVVIEPQFVDGTSFPPRLPAGPTAITMRP